MALIACGAVTSSEAEEEMFYPVEIDVVERGRIKQATAVLNPAESKRLLAKAVVSLPEIQHAYKNGRLLVATCSTSAFVLEELTGEKLEPHCYCIGMVADGMLTTSAKDDREAARFLVKGEQVTEDVLKFLDSFEVGDAVIKGANAIDPYGNAGVLASNSQGGTVGALISFIAVRGLPIIMPIGLEKLVPDVIEAANGWGQRTLDRSMGEKVWLVPVTCGLVVTEIEALGILAGVEARHVASGGIGGSEGAVVLLIEGSERDLDKAWQILESIKGEAPVAVPRHSYSC
jgi:hypothetical protein